MAATSIDFREFGAHAPGRATCLVFKHLWLQFSSQHRPHCSRGAYQEGDVVEVRGSQAVHVLFNKEDVYGL